jgi:hypothetical protein
VPKVKKLKRMKRSNWSGYSKYTGTQQQWDMMTAALQHQDKATRKLEEEVIDGLMNGPSESRLSKVVPKGKQVKKKYDNHLWRDFFDLQQRAANLQKRMGNRGVKMMLITEGGLPSCLGSRGKGKGSDITIVHNGTKVEVGVFLGRVTNKVNSASATGLTLVMTKDAVEAHVAGVRTARQKAKALKPGSILGNAKKNNSALNATAGATSSGISVSI